MRNQENDCIAHTIEMANNNIIALADGDAVPVRALADHLRMHPVDVAKDLKSRGYALGPQRSRPVDEGAHAK